MSTKIIENIARDYLEEFEKDLEQRLGVFQDANIKLFLKTLIIKAYETGYDKAKLDFENKD